MRQIVALACVAALCLGFTPGRSRAVVTPTPDAKFGSLGDNVYSETGMAEALPAKIKPGHSKSIDFQAQNDSTGSDTLLVESVGVPPASFIVHYFAGTTDVTSAVTGAGYSTGTLLSGAEVDFTVKIKVKKSAPSGLKNTFSIRAVSDASKGSIWDEIKVKAKIP